MDGKLDVVVWGATGFTGSLVAEYLATHHPPGVAAASLAGADDADRPLAWALGGRSEERLAAVRARLAAINPACADVPLLVGDAADPPSLAAVAQATRVVASTAGPFARYGSALVAACAAAGTHYCDITGEAPWVRDMIAAHAPAAQASGAVCVSFCGFDSIPADLGTHFLVDHVRATYGEDVDCVTAGVSASGGASGGTIASAINLMDNFALADFADPFLLNPPSSKPALASRPDGGAFERDRRGVAWDPVLGAYTAPFVMAGVNTRVVRRSAALAAAAGAPYAAAFRYNEALRFRSFVPALLATAAVSLLGICLYFRATRFVVSKFLPAPGQGPSAAKRASSSFRYTLATRRSNGDVVRARVAGGCPGYGETSKMLAEAAIVLARFPDALPGTGGFYTPAFALGATLRHRLVDAGLVFEIED